MSSILSCLCLFFPFTDNDKKQQIHLFLIIGHVTIAISDILFPSNSIKCKKDMNEGRDLKGEWPVWLHLSVHSRNSSKDCQKREMENVFQFFLNGCQVRESLWTPMKGFQRVALDGETSFLLLKCCSFLTWYLQAFSGWVSLSNPLHLS